jgi:hypothetical protein
MAQPGGPPPSRTEVRAEPLPGGEVARLETTWADTTEGCATRLLIPGAAPVVLARGPAAGTLASGQGSLLVAYAVEDPRQPFRYRLVQRGDAGYRVGDEAGIERPGGTQGIPFAVVATTLPDGFAVFFQEVEAQDPSAAHTYLLRVDAQGVPRAPATEVAVPWSLADAIWNGQGYHLALLYPGGEGLRLSMVSLTAEGRPQQHPDWASAAGYIADVHLVAAGGRIRAFFRGGSGGDRLLERDVTEIRGWGTEPPAARDHGALPHDQSILVELSGGGVRARGVSR